MFSLIRSSLIHYWRMHLGVLVGVTLAAAVLTGSLLVGDSVDYSLLRFAKQRLGNIDHAISTRAQYFSQRLVEAIGADAKVPTAGALQLRGMAIRQGATTEDRRQINRVEVIGVNEEFWKLAAGSTLALGPNETALNTKLAEALGVAEGGEVDLRMEKPSLLPRDAGLSVRNEDRSVRQTYTVKRVLTDDEMGRYSLSASQIAPYNAFVNRDALQAQVALPNRINLLFASGEMADGALDEALARVWTPEDLGLAFDTHPSGVVQLKSERIFIPAELAKAAQEIPGAQGTLTYLVNGFAKGNLATPYSFAVAGAVPPEMKDDEIIINRWMADKIQAAIGDTITMTYSALLPSNKFEERSRDFKVSAIREMADLVTEKELTPVFPGLTDVDSCADWDVGMPMDEEKLNDKANEDYWDAYKQTPKAFVTLKTGQELWGNRFGDLTNVRFPAAPDTIAKVSEHLKQSADPARAGLVFIPVEAQALAAVQKAMDFGGLFIGMSFFLIVAALLLTGLLFVFGIQHRIEQIGMLLALGFRHKQVRRLFLAEGAVVAVVGSTLGAALSTLYTRGLLHGLATYWQGALANSSIQYHATFGSIAMGAVISLVCALLTMFFALRKYMRKPARELLYMDFSQSLETSREGRGRRATLYIGAGGVALAAIIMALPLVLTVHNAALLGFGAGTLLLLSAFCLCRWKLMSLEHAHAGRPFTFAALALQNVSRRRGRSLATIALLGGGAFMVFAVSSMHEDLYASAHLRSSGTGGYSLLAESTFPLLEKPEFIAKSDTLSAAAIKVRDGDDASCLNLNHSQQPGVLGVNVAEFAARKGFASEATAAGLWERLNVKLEDGAIPALAGDANTAMWTLKKKTGIEKGDYLIYQDEGGAEVKVKLVGALPMRLSVFQGKILMSDENFTRLFPAEDGYRMLLIDAPADAIASTVQSLNRAYDRFGLDAIPPVERILEFYAVETTYLAMFLVLGGLGLAIGSVGMGVVVLRNLLERRGELAMLGALGYPHAAIIRMLYIEYGFLLFAGLGTGIMAASLAIIPSFFATNSQVNVSTQVELALLVFVVSLGCTATAILLGFRRERFDALRSE